MSSEEKEKKEARFVGMAITRMLDNGNNKPDTAFRAAMRRADNPATEHQSWKYLAPYCNLSQDAERQAYALVGASIARCRPESNGKQNLGDALSCCTLDASGEDPMERRLRRILACDDTQELIRILPPILRLLEKNEKVSLNYIRLLEDILRFSEKTKLQWAKQYYHKYQTHEEET